MRISKPRHGHSLDAGLDSRPEPSVFNPLPVGQADQPDHPIQGRRLSSRNVPMRRAGVVARRRQDGGNTVLKTRMPLEEITDPGCDSGGTETAVMEQLQAELHKKGMAVRCPQIRFQSVSETSIFILI